MNRSTVAFIMFLITLAPSCVNTFTCKNTEECTDVFGPAAVCAAPPEGGDWQCYQRARSCEANGVAISSSGKIGDDDFGSAIAAADGNTILVGALNQGATMPILGSAEVFSFTDNNWQSASLLKPNAPVGESSIGVGVSIHKDRALVNATNNAYIFEKMGVIPWATPKSTLSPPSELTVKGYFQSGALLLDNLTITGYNDVNNGVFKVFIYKDSLQPFCVFESSEVGFGTALAYNGRFLAIGARGTAGSAGRVHLVDTSQGCQGAVAVALEPESDAKGGFGKSVAFWGDMLIVGAPDQTAHPFFVYQLNGTVWTRAPNPQTPGAPLLQWGTSLSIDGDLLALGGSNGVLVYQRRLGTWEPLPTGNLTPPVPPAPAAGYDFRTGKFGQSVAVSGDLVVVGAPDAMAPGPMGAAALPAGAVMVYRCSRMQ